MPAPAPSTILDMERVGLDADAPWMWTKRDLLGLLDQRQRNYVETVERVFRVKQANGVVVDYEMQPYQVWFHAHSYLAMGTNAPDRLVEKGRGLGFTLMCAMDALLTAHTLNRIKIPIAGRQALTGDEFIEKTWDLIRDSTVRNERGEEERIFDADEDLHSEVSLGNASRIMTIPGGNPDSIRSMRSVMSVYDEFAFHKLARRLLRAGGPVHSEGGQRTILSTHDGTGTVFYELVEAAREGKGAFKLFSFPIHDPNYNPRESITQQVQAGRLRLIAPWLSLAELDKQLSDDQAGYEQENLARVIDDALLLLTGEAVEAATDPACQHWERPVTLEDARFLRPDEVTRHNGKPSVLEDLIRRGATVPVRPDMGEHATTPVNVGVDFASKGDLAAFTAHEVRPEGDYQRWLLTLKGSDTPEQDALLTICEHTLRHTAEVIDSGGPGTGLGEARVRRSKRHVMPIQFGSGTTVAGIPGTVPIKKAMAVNGLAPRVTSRRLHLLAHPHPLALLQRKHMTAIRRADLDAPRLKKEGHADIFWANALAVWASLHSGGETRIVREATSRFLGRDPLGDLKKHRR